MSKPSTPKRKTGCPLCGAPVTPQNAPFCSAGCRDRDLLSWLGDGYRLPGPVAAMDANDFPRNGLDSEAGEPL